MRWWEIKWKSTRHFWNILIPVPPLSHKLWTMEHICNLRKMDVFRKNGTGCLQETALLSHYFIILIFQLRVLWSLNPISERNTGLYDMYSNRRPTFGSRSVWVLQPEHCPTAEDMLQPFYPQIMSQIQAFYSLPQPHANLLQSGYFFCYTKDGWK